MRLKLLLAVPAAALWCFAQSQYPSRTGTENQNGTANKAEKSASRKYKGILVDANCNPNGGGTANRSQEEANPQAGNEPAAGENNTAPKAKGMSDSATGQWQSCAATPSTSNFGLVVADGRILRFDDAGNAQASSELKNNNKWAASNKPPKVRVKGTLVGDTLEVQSIK